MPLVSQGRDDMAVETVVPKPTAAILMKFFGRKEGQNLKGFHEELKQLSVEEKAELATLVAQEEA